MALTPPPVNLRYRRIAREQRIPVTIPEHRAMALMRRDCALCGTRAPVGGHGLTRLRVWPPHCGAPPPPPGGGAFMGPYDEVCVPRERPTDLPMACFTPPSPAARGTEREWSG